MGVTDRAQKKDEARPSFLNTMIGHLFWPPFLATLLGHHGGLLLSAMLFLSMLSALW